MRCLHDLLELFGMFSLIACEVFLHDLAEEGDLCQLVAELIVEVVRCPLPHTAVLCCTYTLELLNPMHVKLYPVPVEQDNHAEHTDKDERIKQRGFPKRRCDD